MRLWNLASSTLELAKAAKQDKELRHKLWRTAVYFAVFLVFMAIGGFLVAVTGIVPIKASSGHWSITRWFLDFSSQRSISLYALGIQPPLLTEPGHVLRGAGAYDTNCRACHGTPGLPHPRVAQAMTPNPPYLPSVLAEWDNAELFYLVKHGIKFTGMPAWPTQQRDDEVWAMVAFLRKFPSLSPEEYDRLVNGELPQRRPISPLPDLFGAQTIPRAVAVNCGRCHGSDGLGRGENAFPKLAGQNSEYLFSSLEAFALGRRHSGIMEPIAAALSIQEMRELASYYSMLAKSTPALSARQTDPAVERGKQIAERGVPAQHVPSCKHCHGPSNQVRNPNYPEHSGQYADFLESQLILFKNNQRGGTAYAHLMNRVAVNLDPQQMRDVAIYYASE